MQIPNELKNEDGQIGGLTALTVSVVIVGILIVVALYVMKQLGTSLNDTDVTAVIDDMVTGFKNNVPLLMLVLSFGFISTILGVLVALSRAGS